MFCAFAAAYHLNVTGSCRHTIRRKKYTARWYWKTWTQMPESTTKSELSSYYMDDYDGSLTSSGDGTLNWRGNPVCGQVNGAGINCQGMPRSGSPATNPNGGHGCNKMIGNGGTQGGLQWWSGAHFPIVFGTGTCSMIPHKLYQQIFQSTSNIVPISNACLPPPPRSSFSPFDGVYALKDVQHQLRHLLRRVHSPRIFFYQPVLIPELGTIT
jgi:hypothetical protein